MNKTVEELVAMANAMYANGELADLKSGQCSLDRIDEMARRAINAANEGINKFSFWAIGTVQTMYMGDQIKMFRLLLEKLGYKVKVAVEGEDKAAKRVGTNRGRPIFSGSSKKRVISFAMVAGN
jgi:hypothetical protein